MRIAINARLLLPGHLEGIGWYTHELVSRMARTHPECEFLLIFDRAYDARYLYGPNVKAVVAPPQARHPVLWYIWFEVVVPRILRRWKADVFFSPDSYCSITSQVPVVMTVHDLIPLHFPQHIPGKWAARYVLRWLPRFIQRADRIATVSQYVADDLAKTCGTHPERIRVIYNGCREGFRPLSETEKQVVRDEFAKGDPYFLYAGAIHPRKNIPRLLKAFEIFKQKTNAPARLLLAGRWAWQTGAVRAVYEQLSCRDSVEFLGYIPDETLTRLAGAATAVTYVSWSEGFGLPLVEAMYADTPVIAANATALPEVAGKAALLVDPYDEADIANALREVYYNEDLRRQLIAAGRLQRQNFDWQNAANALWEVLNEVIRRPGR